MKNFELPWKQILIRLAIILVLAALFVIFWACDCKECEKCTDCPDCPDPVDCELCIVDYYVLGNDTFAITNTGDTAKFYTSPGVILQQNYFYVGTNKVNPETDSISFMLVRSITDESNLGLLINGIDLGSDYMADFDSYPIMIMAGWNEINEITFTVAQEENEICIVNIILNAVNLVEEWNCTNLEKVDLIGAGKFIIRPGGTITFAKPDA